MLRVLTPQPRRSNGADTLSKWKQDGKQATNATVWQCSSPSKQAIFLLISARFEWNERAQTYTCRQSGRSIDRSTSAHACTCRRRTLLRATASNTAPPQQTLQTVHHKHMQQLPTKHPSPFPCPSLLPPRPHRLLHQPWAAGTCEVLLSQLADCAQLGTPSAAMPVMCRWCLVSPPLRAVQLVQGSFPAPVEVELLVGSRGQQHSFVCRHTLARALQ